MPNSVDDDDETIMMMVMRVLRLLKIEHAKSLEIESDKTFRC